MKTRASGPTCRPKTEGERNGLEDLTSVSGLYSVYTLCSGVSYGRVGLQSSHRRSLVVKGSAVLQLYGGHTSAAAEKRNRTADERTSARAQVPNLNSKLPSLALFLMPNVGRSATLRGYRSHRSVALPLFTLWMPAVAAASSEVEASNHNRLVSLQRRSLLALHSTPLRGLLSCSRQAWAHPKVMDWIS